jgi:hypothetical protein
MDTNIPNTSIELPTEVQTKLHLLREDSFQGDPDSIALYAISILELGIPIEDEFVSLIEKRDSQYTWLGKLACVLVMYLSDKECKNVQHDWLKEKFSEVILLAGKNSDDFYKSGVLDFNQYEFLLNFEETTDNVFAIRLGSLEITKSLLTGIANDFSEIEYILGVAGNNTESRLANASDQKFVLATFRLGFGPYTDNYDEVIKRQIHIRNFVNASDCLPHVLQQRLNAMATNRLVELHDIAEKLRLVSEDKIRAETTENMMAMFAHQFRGSVGSLLFNAEHQHDERLYLSLAHSMFGLLDTFSIVSTTPEKLINSLMADTYGNDSPGRVLLNSIKLVLAELLSKRNRKRISPHYLAYAKRQGIAPSDLKQSEWMREKSWVTKEVEIQTQWEQDIGAMMSVADIHAICQWLEAHLMPVQINGFEESPIQFAEYGSKASILTVVLTEVLVNAIKYSVAGSQQALVITWSDDTSGDIVISCANHSSRDSRQREMSKGSGRGHKFLTLLSAHMGGHFDADVRNDNSRVSMNIPGYLMRGEI